MRKSAGDDNDESDADAGDVGAAVVASLTRGGCNFLPLGRTGDAGVEGGLLDFTRAGAVDSTIPAAEEPRPSHRGVDMAHPPRRDTKASRRPITFLPAIGRWGAPSTAATEIMSLEHTVPFSPMLCHNLAK